MTMVEKVTLAIYRASGDYHAMALAAIEAMRELTDDILHGGTISKVGMTVAIECGSYEDAQRLMDMLCGEGGATAIGNRRA